ncbi:SSI family serine proteinase inhibitor [Parasphingorhabdus pacifica]
MAATRTFARIALAATTMLGAALVPVAVNAEPAGPPASFVSLAVHDNGRGNPLRTATLACEPTGGTHPHATNACGSLEAAGGDPNGLRHEHTMCTLDYQPVTLTAHGNWQGEPLHFEKTYSNICTAKAQTEQVFDF